MAMSSPWHILSLALLMTLTSVGCSSGSGAKGGGGGDNFGGDGSNQTFLGAWSGHYGNRPTNAGTTLTDVHFAKAQFVGDQDQSAGTFKIDLTDVANATMSGTFKTVQSTLQLAIGNSSISTIGEPGQPAELQYSLIGNTLTLQNDSVALKLSRDAGTDDGSKTTPTTPTTPGTGLAPGGQDPVIGTWKCQDPKGNNWQLLTRDNNTFNADVFAPGATRGGLFLDGTLTITRGKTGSDADAELVVTTSDVAKYVGWTFRVNVTGNAATLRRMAPAAAGQAPQTAEIIQCTKAG